MPEGDSVYRLARRLDAALLGQQLGDAQLRVPRLATAELRGRHVEAHETHGKHLFTHLGGLTLHTHLRMDGSWTVVRTGRRLPARLDGDVRVLLPTVDGPTAYGLLIPVVELLDEAGVQRERGRLGPDPLRPDWDAELAGQRLLGDPSRPVAAALLDQTLMAGLGNLWANELCFLRGCSPWTPIGEIDVPAMVRLAARALRISATVDGMYQVTTGNRRRGEQHWVAGRAGRPCLRCGTVVRVAAATGGTVAAATGGTVAAATGHTVAAAGAPERRTWWCPSCQPGPTRPR